MSTPTAQSHTGVLRQINDHIITLSKPFTAFSVMKFGGRATLVRLTNGTVAVFSPVPLTDGIRRVVANHGPLRYIVAINMEHYLFAKEWRTAYPDALVIAPEGLREKRFAPKKTKCPGEDDGSLHFDVIMRSCGRHSVDPAFDADFDIQFVSSHFNKELVFNFRPTRTLIEGDLWFNLPCVEQYSKSDEDPTSGVPTKLMIKAHSARGDSAIRKTMLYGFCKGNTKDFGEQLKLINTWDFDSIIPCHGTTVETGGKAIFGEAFQTYL
ncbi:MAG: hypothetical protein M1828_005616 [Chrysothrix sp. TS-e1954]|nr:MAG: hypothetical protein M1828_005616 [Chrysothrix sp. TS-e1954]